jgi:hypothetical protein
VYILHVEYEVQYDVAVVDDDELDLNGAPAMVMDHHHSKGKWSYEMVLQ